METVYIETSVVSYLVAGPNRDPITAWRQQLTRDWWDEQRNRFACVISREVIVEAQEGDSRDGEEADGVVAGYALDFGRTAMRN